MQEALGTYLGALAILAADGVLPYRDDMCLEREARDPAALQSVRDWAALYDREFASRAAERTQYGLVLTRIGEGHALLRARASHMAQEETVRQIRAQKDSLRRASVALPRAPVAVRQRLGDGADAGRSGESSAVLILAARLDDRLSEADR